MLNKFFLPALLLLFGGCGRDVNISTQKLESQSNVLQDGSQTKMMDGILIRGSKDVIDIGGKIYGVSPYCSHRVLTFISSKPKDSQTPVKFRGKFSGNEVIIDLIE